MSHPQADFCEGLLVRVGCCAPSAEVGATALANAFPNLVNLETLGLNNNKIGDVRLAAACNISHCRSPSSARVL